MHSLGYMSVINSGVYIRRNLQFRFANNSRIYRKTTDPPRLRASVPAA